MLEQVPNISLLALGKIIWLDILLSGDNAIVIAAVCTGLPRRQRLAALIFGTVLAIVLRIGFTGSAAYLLTLPGLRMFGGLALLYIATKMLAPNGGSDGIGDVASSIMSAIIAIAMADLSMSIDNILAVAALADGNIPLLMVGLLCSIPLVMGAAAIITIIIERFPVLIWTGAALLGWVAGELIASDPLLGARMSALMCASICAVCVIIAAGIWRNFDHIKQGGFR